MSEERKAIFQRNWERLPQEEIDKLAPQDRRAMRAKNMAPMFWYDPHYDPFWHFAGRRRFEPMRLHIMGVLMQEYDPRGTLAEITVPVFLALGRYDCAVPYALWEEAEDLPPNLSLHLFDKSGHFPMYEEPALFDKKLVEWLERHPRRT